MVSRVGGLVEEAVTLVAGDATWFDTGPRGPFAQGSGRMTAATPPLAGKVALVTGQPAARGAASPSRSARRARPSTAPAAARATHRSEYDRPETIEDTAELVDAAGGTGIAVAVDHLDPGRSTRSSGGSTPSRAGSTCS
jgi:hypothetical protein